MSRLDPQALLKSLGYATDLPDVDELKRLDLARGESLMSKTMAARAARKSNRAQQQIDAKTNTSGVAGAIGSVLNFAAGKRDRAAGEADELTQERLFNKSQAALQNAAAAKAQRAEQNALGGHAQDIMLDREGNATTLEGKRITARQSNRNSIRTAQTAANTAAAAKQAAELKRDDKLWDDMGKYAKDIQGKEKLVFAHGRLAQFVNDHPEVPMHAGGVHDIKMSMEAIGEAMAGVEILDNKKDASTITQKREKHYNGVRNPAVAEMDAIYSRAPGELSEADRQALAELIAETPGIEEYGGNSAMDQIERLQREANRATRERVGEEQNRIDDEAVASSSAEELNNAFNSTRNEYVKERAAKVELANTETTSAQWTVDGHAIDEARRPTLLQKELYWLTKQAVVLTGLEIGATTLTDDLRLDIMKDFGMTAGVGPQGFRKAVSIKRGAALNDLYTAESGVDPRIAQRYRDVNKQSVLNTGIPAYQGLEGGDAPTAPVTLNDPLDELGASSATPGQRLKEIKGTPKAAAIDASSLPDVGKAVHRGIGKIPVVGGVLSKAINAVKGTEQPDQGSVLPNARQQMQQQQAPMQQPPMSPQDERKRLLLQALAAQQQQSSSQRIV